MKRRWLPYLLGALPVLAPVVVYAAASSGGLVPCGVGDSIQNATSCNACNFVQLIQNIINFIIVIAIPIAALLFAYAGFRLITAGGNPAVRTAARKIVTSTAIGFIVVLVSWTIVNTLIYYLVAQNYFTTSSWFNLTCEPTCTSNSPDQTGCRQVEGSIANAIVGGVTGSGLSVGSGAAPSQTTTVGTGGSVSDPQMASNLAAACQQSGIACDIPNAIAGNESSGGQNCTSSSTGAAGCMQVLATTACGVDSSIDGCGACLTNGNSASDACATVRQTIQNDPQLGATVGVQYIKQIEQNPKLQPYIAAEGECQVTAAAYFQGPGSILASNGIPAKADQYVLKACGSLPS